MKEGTLETIVAVPNQIISLGLERFGDDQIAEVRQGVVNELLDAGLNCSLVGMPSRADFVRVDFDPGRKPFDEAMIEDFPDDFLRYGDDVLVYAATCQRSELLARIAAILRPFSTYRAAIETFLKIS